MSIYKKNIHLSVFIRKLIKYAPFPPPPTPPPWLPPKPSSILNQAGPAQDPAGPAIQQANTKCNLNSTGNTIDNTIGNKNMFWKIHFFRTSNSFKEGLGDS